MSEIAQEASAPPAAPPAPKQSAVVPQAHAAIAAPSVTSAKITQAPVTVDALTALSTSDPFAEALLIAPPPPSNFLPMTPLKAQPRPAWQSDSIALAKAEDLAASATDGSDIETSDHASSSGQSLSSEAACTGASAPQSRPGKVRRHVDHLEVSSASKGSQSKPSAVRGLNLDAVAHTVSPQRSNLLGGNAFESRLTKTALLNVASQPRPARLKTSSSPGPKQRTASPLSRSGSPTRGASPVVRKRIDKGASPGRPLMPIKPPLAAVGAGGGNRFRASPGVIS